MMSESTRAVPSDDMTSGTSVASALLPEQAMRRVESIFGPEAELYAVDHAVEVLTPVRASDARLVPLEGPLRRAILRAESFTDGGVAWFPIPERDQTVFVVRVGDAAASEAGDAHDLSLGAVLNGHRRRFEELERPRRRRDMSVAAELQWDLLPVRGDFFEGGRVAGILEPAYEVAGDAFDYMWWDGALWAYSFDGMGHGIDATLTSAVVLAAVRNARRQGHGLVEQMNRANRAMFDQWGGDRFVTGVACRVASGVTEFVNAGHEPPRVVQSGSVTRLDLRAELPLGVDVTHEYSVQEGPTLGAGDGVALFSDGPGNAHSDRISGSLGADGLDEILQRSWSDRPFEAANDTMSRVLEFIGGAEVQDDLTAVLVRLDSSATAR